MRVPASIGAIESAAEGLCGLNYRLMHTARVGGGGFPVLYDSGIVYRREVAAEDWQNAIDLLRSGRGDCEDLAAYRAAELRCDGEPATVAIKRTRRGSYHAVVRRADGTTEDPSRILLELESLDRGIPLVQLLQEMR